MPSAVHPFNLSWQLTSWFWLPLIRRLLPKPCVMAPDWAWNTRQENFDRLGTESFLVVSAEEITLFSESAEVVEQVMHRREAFPKDTAKYDVLAMFGRNVLTTEGALWRMHRKVTSASFNEKNAAKTFAQAIAQTQGLIGTYFGSPAQERAGTTGTITSLEHDAMTWALNTIAYVGFGLQLLWPGQELPGDIDPKLAKYGSLEPPPGYTMNFATSLATVLHRIIALLVFPVPVLKLLPFEWARQAWSAKENYSKYMDDFLREKLDEVRRGDNAQVGMDIMGQLVRSKYEQSQLKKSDGAKQLEDSDIVGNAFIMTLAGHETTANILHFLLIELATNPGAQRRLQQDIDALFGDSDPAAWNYEDKISAVLASHIGACVNETLRLMPPVTGIPKIVSADGDQTITIDGKPHVLPVDMTISLLAVSVHRNPRWWPTRPSERSGAATDLDDYLPERWFRPSLTPSNSSSSSSSSSSNNSSSGPSTAANEAQEDYGGFQGSDTSASLYRPVRGSFVPFSDGPRSCLGRRIAMVEMVAAVATIFQRHSIELAVDELATDDEVGTMGAEERRRVYAKAQYRSRDTLRQATSILTLKLHDGKFVPSLKKNDLELQLDEYLSENATQFQSNPRLGPYFNLRARTAGSPVKREAPELKVSKRRATKAADEIVAVETPSDDEDSQSTTTGAAAATTGAATSRAASSTSTALARTPGRALALASRIPLPATPADVASAVDRGTVVVRERVASLYAGSGIGEATAATRESLSTVRAVVLAVAAFELYFLRPEVLPDRYAFTVPAIKFLGTPDVPVSLPDMFALLTASFWGPALTWALTSWLVPSLLGYLFNLSAAANSSSTTGSSVYNTRGRPSSAAARAAAGAEYVVDPLTFSIAKALATYVVYAQGVTFGGWLDPQAVARVNTALYSGWKGVLVGSAITGLTAVYDAVLRK
ncbi:cytochrome P450 [Lasiosphaeria miniovina]|uniref:Cytochrome P450 n=1 Tax=Lasiosphaeria miniovina TaxID=1954250 RepID=A0AA40B3N6_9PEZI|nr:cytochrome P450 [Lasiosphaeria miniovina]KAK0727093.1 cytochrome P450 [Lasiosphaeria miniovina]